MQCVIYLRVSTRNQAFGNGLERQLGYCREYAKANSLWIAGIYTDIASGAGDLPMRDIAVDDARQNGRVILVEAIDRFTRKSECDDLYDESLDIRVCAPWSIETKEKLSGIINAALAKAEGR